MTQLGSEGRVSILRRANSVVLVNHDLQDLGLAMTWRVADDVARTIRSIRDRHIDIGPHKIDTHITVRGEADGDPFILVEYDGRMVFLARYAAAVYVSNLVTAKAREIEEEEVADQVAADEALNLRGNLMPFGLSANPYIRKQAENEAAYGTEPRKYIPISRIEANWHPLPPTVIQLSPDADITQRIANLTPEEREAIRKELNRAD